MWVHLREAGCERQDSQTQVSLGGRESRESAAFHWEILHGPSVIGVTTKNDPTATPLAPLHTPPPPLKAGR